MRSNRRRGGSAALTRARRQFEKWRRTKRGRERIPDTLWTLAVGAAKEHGVNETSRALRLNHSALQAEAQKRAAVSVVIDEPPAGFVELPMAADRGGVECIMEADDGDGRRLRIHLKGAAGADLACLAESLWRPER